MLIYTCPTCEGTGKFSKEKCTACQGAGQLKHVGGNENYSEQAAASGTDYIEPYFSENDAESSLSKLEQDPESVAAIEAAILESKKNGFS